MHPIPEQTHNTKPDDAGETIWTPTTIRLLALNIMLLLLIAAGLVAVFIGLGHGFWLQIRQVFS